MRHAKVWKVADQPPVNHQSEYCADGNAHGDLSAVDAEDYAFICAHRTDGADHAYLRPDTAADAARDLCDANCQQDERHATDQQQLQQALTLVLTLHFHHVIHCVICAAHGDRGDPLFQRGFLLQRQVMGIDVQVGYTWQGMSHGGKTLLSSHHNHILTHRKAAGKYRAHGDIHLCVRHLLVTGQIVGYRTIRRNLDRIGMDIVQRQRLTCGIRIILNGCQQGVFRVTQAVLQPTVIAAPIGVDCVVW